jgi:hypothetical protein
LTGGGALGKLGGVGSSLKLVSELPNLPRPVPIHRFALTVPGANRRIQLPAAS